MHRISGSFSNSFAKQKVLPKSSKMIGVSKAVISKYEITASYPTYQTLLKMADVFKVSTDFLLGANRNNTVDVSYLTHSQVEVVMHIISEFEKINSKTEINSGNES